MIDLSWMAWTWPTAPFFIAIFAIIALFIVHDQADVFQEALQILELL